MDKVLREFKKEFEQRLHELKLPNYRLVICRNDLPENPDWHKLGYPGSRCWDVIELMKKASEAGKDSLLWQDARRIYFEMYWRGMGRYKRGRPFPEVYFCDVGAKICVKGIPDIGDEEDPRVKHIVMAEVITSAMLFGIGIPGYGAYRRIFGKRVLR